MRMLLCVTFPNEPFNTMVRKGTVGQTVQKILDDLKPEAVYFTEYDGKRTAMLIVDLNDSSQVPAMAEPWFLNFDAQCCFQIVMTPADLQAAGLEALGKKWG